MGKKNKKQNKKRFKKIYLFYTLLAILLFLFTSTPSPEEYTNWLEEKYQIKCEENDYKCYDYKNNRNITFKSETISDRYLLFSLQKTTFNDEQNKKTLQIKAIGLLGTFLEIK
jgi:hypothetical protein